MLLLGPALALLLSGCTLSTTCDTADADCVAGTAAGTFAGEASVTRLTWGCCNPATDSARCGRFGTWWYDLVLDGTIVAAELDISERLTVGQDTWSETHPLPVSLSDPSGYWEDRYLELDAARTSDCASRTACASRFEAGATTLFTCDSPTWQDDMTWTVRLFADSATQSSACLTWGADAELAVGCTVVTPDAQTPSSAR